VNKIRIRYLKAIFKLFKIKKERLLSPSSNVDVQGKPLQKIN
jgi:hypothetical protein